MSEKLQVLVSLEPTLPSATVRVHGSVTVENISILDAILRRADSLNPGMDLTLDLSEARTSPEASTHFHGASRQKGRMRSGEPVEGVCRVNFGGRSFTHSF